MYSIIISFFYFQFIRYILSKRTSKLFITTPPSLALGWFGLSSNNSNTSIETKELSDEEVAVIESDKLFDENEIEKLYEYLMKFKLSENAEIVWRLARAARNKAELCKNVEDKKKFTYEAYEFAQKAVELDDKNFACHKVCGVLYEGLTMVVLGPVVQSSISVNPGFS